MFLPIQLARQTFRADKSIGRRHAASRPSSQAWARQSEAVARAAGNALPLKTAPVIGSPAGTIFSGRCC
jgi:hypothetical protein